jgi:hypothetical protein
LEKLPVVDIAVSWTIEAGSLPPAHKKSWNDVKSEMGGEIPDSTQVIESAPFALRLDPGDGPVKRTSAMDNSKIQSMK